MPFPLIAVAIAVIAVGLSAILLKPKARRPDSTTDLDDPVAEAGKPVGVVFGEITVKGLNILAACDKWKDKHKITPGDGK